MVLEHACALCFAIKENQGKISYIFFTSNGYKSSGILHAFRYYYCIQDHAIHTCACFSKNNFHKF